MKKFLTIAIGILCSFSLLSQAPGINWQKVLGGSDTDAALDMITTPDGGYMIAGTSQSQDGDVDTNYGDYDYWFVKIGVNGEIEWKQNYGGTDWDWPRSIKNTQDGGYIAVGLTYSDDLDVSGFHDFRDGWVIKLGSTGEIMWQKCLGGSGPNTARDVVEVNDGFLVAAFDGGENDGDLQGMGCKSDFWIVKLDFNGNIVWQKCYGGSRTDLVSKIIPDGNGGFIIAGYTESDDGDVTGHHGSLDYWVIRIDAAGNLIWQKALGGSSWDELFDAHFSVETGTIVLVGASLSDDGDVSMNRGDTDYWVAFLDIDGNLLFERSYGGSKEDKATVVIPSGDDYLVAGVAASSDGQVSGNHGNGDFWLIKISGSDGSLLWNTSMGGSGYDQPYAAVQATDDDGILLTGHTNSRDGDIINFYGSDDIWLVKAGGVSVSTSELSPGLPGLSIYPNPGRTTDRVFVDHNLADPQLLTVRDALGREVKVLRTGLNDQPLRLAVTGWPAGTYFLELRGMNGQQQNGRLMILR